MAPVKDKLTAKIEALRVEADKYTGLARKANEKRRLLEALQANPEAQADVLEALK